MDFQNGIPVLLAGIGDLIRLDRPHLRDFHRGRRFEARPRRHPGEIHAHGVQPAVGVPVHDHRHGPSIHPAQAPKGILHRRPVDYLEPVRGHLERASRLPGMAIRVGLSLIGRLEYAGLDFA